MFFYRLTYVASNGVNWCAETTISRQSLWMTLCWLASLGAWPETFCACGGAWPHSSRPPPRARTPRIKVCSNPSVYLRDSADQDPSTLRSHSMLPRSSGSSGMARSQTSQGSLPPNLLLLVSPCFFSSSVLLKLFNAIAS